MALPFRVPGKLAPITKGASAVLDSAWQVFPIREL
jgi:hypothetical protein